MADLTRTKCGLMPHQGKYMLKPTMLTVYFDLCYKNLFSPFVRKTCNFVQILMGYHSEVFAIPKPQISSTENGIE